MSGLLAELKWRGFVHDATPGLDAHLARGPVTVYCGFDPTAPSLQLGNLIPLMLLKHLQLGGHRPIVLMGGGTGLIGDPSGKRAERPLLSNEQIREHLERQRAQMARFLDFNAGRAFLLDNAEWLVTEPLVGFLRDVGKHFTINVMLQKESVKARLEAGLSFTEFSYMLLQAFDFLQLFRRKGCTLQVGGSDQWGNITAGVELIRRVEGAEAHALVAPLATTASGSKFGKSETGAIYLDPALTSPYKFYQYWYNTDDRDLESHLRLFTLLPKDAIRGLCDAHKKDPGARAAQVTLASEVTERVHGPDAVANATAVNAILFSDVDPRQVPPGTFDVLAQEIPGASVAAADGIPLIDALVTVGLAKSKSEARRQIQQGGVSVNQQREKSVDRVLGPADRLAGRHVLLRKGKKDYALLRVGR
ncbi:MAG TPA: tyrosine--tRNA ligase [Gemmatimonadales bacterium]|jgi:tyrosyl-tRNA synthetase